MFETYIINDEQSYTGDFIKQWCSYQIANNTNYRNIAEDLNCKYFLLNDSKKPNPKVYYYVESVTNHTFGGLYSYYLSRDIIKNPRKLNK